MSGAAYAAWVEKARLSRMNGYGSQCLARAMVLSAIQPMTSTVWPTRKRPVPRNRAIASENRPNASASYRAPIRGVAPRGTDRSVRSTIRRAGNRAISASRSPPAHGQHVVQHVVHGDRAEQAAVLVAHGHADQVVGGEPGRQLALGQIGPDEDAPLDAVADLGGGRPAQQPLEPHAAEVAAGRRHHGRLAHVDLHGRGDRRLRVPDPGQHLRYRHVRGDDKGLGGHQAARRRGVVTQQAPEVRGLDGLHRGQQPLALLGRHLGEQVRGVVWLHLLHHVGAALELEAGQQPDLVLFGHLLEQVGQFLVVQGIRQLAAPAGRHALDGGGEVGRLQFPQADQLVGERAGMEQLGILVPRHDRRAPVAQAPAVREGERADLPAHPPLLAGNDGDIGDSPGLGLLAVQLGGEDLPGPPGEAVQVDGAAVQVRAVDGDLRDPAEVDEDAASLQRHDQAERAGRFAPGRGQDHHVADPADGQALAVEQRTAPQPGREYLAPGHDLLSPPALIRPAHYRPPRAGPRYRARWPRWRPAPGWPPEPWSVTSQQRALAVLRAARGVVAGGPAGAAGLELERLGVGRLVHRGPETVVVDELDRLDGVLGGDVTVGEAHQVVAVLLLAAGGEVGGAGEHERVLPVEVGDDEFVVDDLAYAAAPLGLERRRDLVGKIGEGDERRVGGIAGFLYLEGAVESLRGAEGIELRARRQRPDGVEERAGAGADLHDGEQDGARGAGDGAGHAVERHRSAMVRAEADRVAGQAVVGAAVVPAGRERAGGESGGVVPRLLEGLFVEGRGSRVVEREDVVGLHVQAADGEVRRTAEYPQRRCHASLYRHDGWYRKFRSMTSLPSRPPRSAPLAVSSAYRPPP